MSLAKDKKAEIMAEYRLHEKDTGSTEVQIALLTKRIQELTEQMRQSALDLRFEVAARLRDEIGDLKKELRQIENAGRRLRVGVVTVMLMTVVGVTLSVVGPKILGNATNLIFEGVIGQQLPAGITQEQAIAALRADGQDQLADLLSGMTVVPGQGVDFETVLGTCRHISPRLPVVLMAYANTVLGVGPSEFAKRAVEAGASGVIVPDLPFGEDEEVNRVLLEHGLAVIPLIAPTTLPERRAEICAAARGFVYVVSTVGTTGESKSLPADLTELVGHAKAEATAPVAVGFGIGTPEQAAQVGEVADGVIIGSRLVRAVGEASDTAAAVEAVAGFLSQARRALEGDRPA